MKLPVFGRLVDERFLMHRLRSTSVGGVVGGIVAGVLFLFRFYFQQVQDWYLFAVLATIVAVKLTLMVYYFWKE
jgi:hypothetical protein